MKNKKVLAFVSTIAVIFLGIFVIVSINTNKQKVDTPTSESHSYSSKWVQSNDSERIALMSKTMQKLPDVETAKKNVPFKVKVPKDTKNKKLLATFISKDENSKVNGMTLYYETGLFIEIRPQESVDYEGIVKQFEKEKEKGNLKSDNLPKVINFRGVKAFAGEPGYNVWDNYKEPRAGVLMWCEGGVQYSVYGFNMSLDNIKQVANSIE